MAGNQGNNRIVWQEWQIKFLRENFQSMTAGQLSNSLGIARTSVRTMYYSMGLSKQEMEYWTDEQVAFLRSIYKLLGDSEIARIFSDRWPKKKGWKKKHIEKKRSYLFLKRTPDEIRKIKIKNIEDSCFKICPIKAWETRGGGAPEGEIRFWKIAGVNTPVIKVNNAWVHWARHKWIQTHGAIRKGILVVFKDGNHHNLEITNLECITRRQHAIRNKTKFNQLPEDLQASIKAINKLKKQIKKCETK